MSVKRRAFTSHFKARVAMEGYGIQVERMMQRLYLTLSEKVRRRYAAVEAARFGHGGIVCVAGLLGCGRKTIDRGRVDLGFGEGPAAERVRKKGADADGYVNGR